MAMRHGVYDTDTHFSINPTTRVLKNEGLTKNTLVQYDHNSERVTFEIPRTIEGHDISLCNKVQVHFDNIDAVSKAESRDVYDVDDMQISPEDENVVILSWLISGKATKYVGSLNFLIRFSCVDESGKILYAWNTAICKVLSVSAGIYNSKAVVEEYSDVLQKWYEDLLQAAKDVKDGVTPLLQIYDDNELAVSYDNGNNWTSLGILPRGEQGEQGPEGLSTRWYTGTGIDGTKLVGKVYENSEVDYANEGDMYLNKTTGGVYQCTFGGAPSLAKWALKCNIKGPVPVKGTDYFTDEDKQAIITAVIDGLPVYNGEVVDV